MCAYANNALFCVEQALDGEENLTEAEQHKIKQIIRQCK